MAATEVLFSGRPTLSLHSSKASCFSPPSMASSTFRPVLIHAQQPPSTQRRLERSSANRGHHGGDSSLRALATAQKRPNSINAGRRRGFRTSAAVPGPSIPADRRNERDGSETASSSGSWEIPDRGELEYKWLIEGGEKGPVKASDNDDEEVEWEEYEEEVEIEEGQEYEKVVYREEEEEEAPPPYPFSMAETVHVGQFKLWPEQWPDIRELQEKVKKMFTADEAKHVIRLSDPVMRKRYPITTNYDFDFRLAIMELFISLVREEHGFAIVFLVPDGRKEPANNSEVGMSIAVRNVLEHPRTKQPYLEVMYQDHSFTKHLLDNGEATTEQVAEHYQMLMSECTPARQPEPKQILCSERMFARFRRLLQENEVLIGEVTKWQEARRTDDWRPSFIQCFENVDFDKHQGLAESLRAQGLKPVKVGRDWYVTPLVPGDEGYDPQKAAKIAEEGPPGKGYKQWIGVDVEKVGPMDGVRKGKGPSIETYEMPGDLGEIKRSMEDMDKETEESLRTAQVFAKKYGLPLNEAIEALAQLEEMEAMAEDDESK